jgi:hypothetical protein
MRPYAAWLLAQEARSLLNRVDRMQPFVLIEPMVPAAALPDAAQSAIERHLTLGRRTLRALVRQFLAWLEGPGGGAPRRRRRNGASRSSGCSSMPR